MNTKTKKIIAMILGLALTISLFGGAAVFAAGTVAVSIEAPETVVNGNTVAVTASATATVDVTDGLAAYSVKITYDTTEFSYDDLDPANITKSANTPAGGDLSVNNDEVNGILYILYICGPAVTVTPVVTPIPLEPMTLTFNDPTALFTATFDTIAIGSGDFVISGIDTSGDNFVGATSSIVSTFGAEATKTVTVEDNAPTPVSIAWKTQPTKTVYMIGKTTWGVGENLDLTSGAITVTYSDSSTVDVALSNPEVAITGYDKDAQTTGTTTQTVTVKYGSIATGVTYTVRVLKIGDLNNNGNITSGDALTVLKGAAQTIVLTNEQMLTADTNRNGLITSGDSLKVLKFAAGTTTTI